MAKMIKRKKEEEGLFLCQLSDKSNLEKNNMKGKDLKVDSLNIHLAIFPWYIIPQCEDLLIRLRTPRVVRTCNLC